MPGSRNGEKWWRYNEKENLAQIEKTLEVMVMNTEDPIEITLGVVKETRVALRSVAFLRQSIRTVDCPLD